MDKHWPEASVIIIKALHPDPKKNVTTLNYSDWFKDWKKKNVKIDNKQMKLVVLLTKLEEM